MTINIQKSVAFLYTNNEISERECKQSLLKLHQVALYKINTQKSLAFLYTNNERSETEIKETIPFEIEQK